MTAVRLSKMVDEEGKEQHTLKVEGDLKNAEEQVPLNPEAEPKKKGIDWEYWLRYVSLVVLVLQNTGQVLLMRYATRREQTQFLKTVAVFWNEVFKLVAATILFIVSTGSLKDSLRAFKHHFITDWFDTLKVGVPAVIYTIQNFLLYVAIEHLDAATYMVTYQLKILTTAIFTVLMLKRRLSIVQWISLCVLIAGVVLVQINAEKSAGDSKSLNTTTDLITTTLVPTTTINSDNAPAVQRPWVGLIAVLIACVMSGFAGIYFEKILKGSNVSIWLRNIQLAVLALPISLIVIGIKDRDRVMKDGFMQGFDMVVWGVVAIQAFGGLVVAVVIKYADNILKAFATSISIVVSAIAAIFLFKLIPKLMFIGGAALVIGAVVLYSIFPYKAPKSQEPEKVDLDKKENGSEQITDGVDLENGVVESGDVVEQQEKAN